MLNIQEEVQRKYWTIGQVAKIIRTEIVPNAITPALRRQGCPSSVIRFWCTTINIFNNSKIHRSKNSNRLFTEKQKELILFVARLKYLEGYTHAGIQRQYKLLYGK